jgi:hypothetical protein
VSAAAEFMKAIFARLNQDATLKTLLEAGRGSALTLPLPIFANMAPPSEVFPYLTFNQVAATEFDTSSTYGREVQIDVHVWSYKQSPAETYGLLSRVETLLRGAALTLPAPYHPVLVMLEQSQVELDEDGRTFHGVATARALITEGA